ncbi:hypothetical protein GCM10023235_00040 [Kitasatospora terrestris]|uniref:Uncharacterized protein n=1 Tax=Kitasatospora terrestris TaxID=258051 RepID=A0ABP9D687_9ACTN
MTTPCIFHTGVVQAPSAEVPVLGRPLLRSKDHRMMRPFALSGRNSLDSRAPLARSKLSEVRHGVLPVSGTHALVAVATVR